MAGAGVIWRHTHPLPSLPAPRDRGEGGALQRHPHAELQLAHQQAKTVTWSAAAEAGWVTEQADQSLIALFDPLGDALDADRLSQVARAARHADRTPMLYKCSARMAADARRAGWQVAAIAEDAVLDPARFDLSARACRQARRKRRKAEQAGVQANRATGALPLRQMAEVAREWAAATGGERGFSMSRFASAPLDQQAVFLAWSGNRLIAFISFHVSTTGWALDLVRHRGGAPDGTMHALVIAALEAARSAKVSRFSLAAVPVHPSAGGDMVSRIQRNMVKKMGGTGLRQFKASFGPRWDRRYMAAPTRAALGLGVWDVQRRVRAEYAPAPNGPPHAPDGPFTLRPPHEEHEHYEIA
jgi:phosphatidylglycerol lysyltransferase